MKKKLWLLTAFAIVCVLALAGVLFGTSRLPWQNSASTKAALAAKTVDAHNPGAPIDGMTCESMEGAVLHFHVHLTLIVDGELQSIPENTGIEKAPNTCYYWVHTHDSSGIVHIESPVKRTFFLGDFFKVWEQPLTDTKVGPYGNGQPIHVYVNGEPYQGDPAGLELKTHQEITLEVGPSFVSPPASFHFPDDLQ